MSKFSLRNGWRLETTFSEIVELVLAVESDKWKVAEIENWLHQRVNSSLISNLTDF